MDTKVKATRQANEAIVVKETHFDQSRLLKEAMKHLTAEYLLLTRNEGHYNWIW